ncbi:MAG: acylneuraminate cytidylyltransferase family protein [Clostridia bacterium]|nr:acylneuraminate cytidylyltransferase family protein [Clostridia bacterium]
MENIVAIIPARSGSKGVINKNIRLMNGKPLMAYSIEQALASKRISRVIVSTDDDSYAAIAKEYGAEVPFLRPKEISGDSALDLDLFYHAYNYLKNVEGYNVDVFVHLRPTHPIRDAADIDKMIDILLSDDSADSIRSVSPAKFTPYKMWFYNTDGTISPILECDIPEAYNSPRQKLPKVYEQNACIDVIKAKTIAEKHSMTGDKILGYKMEYDYDIDTEEDFLYAEKVQLLKDTQYSKKKLKIVCDIDGIIAEKTIANDYSLATPIRRNIEIINKLFDCGHNIVLFTARGYTTGIDWSEITEKQMKKWGVKYNSIIYGKPNADFYIDDKFIELCSLNILNS